MQGERQELAALLGKLFGPRIDAPHWSSAHEPKWPDDYAEVERRELLQAADMILLFQARQPGGGGGGDD